MSLWPDDAAEDASPLGTVRRDTRAPRDVATFAATMLAVLSTLALFRAWRARQFGLDELGTAGAGLVLAHGFAHGRRGLGRSTQVLTAALLGVAAWSMVANHPPIMIGATIVVGAVLLRPEPPPAATIGAARRHVAALVDATGGDALAPFALRTDKAHVSSADGRAVIGYRVRFGTAVAAGDPVGEPSSYEGAVRAFFDRADAAGWRVAVLGASERSLALWRKNGLRALPIGRDVIVDPDHLLLVGRRFRNLRQAVARSHNAGVSTEVVCEQDLDSALRSELLEVVARSSRSINPRGFAMILDGLLTGVHPGTFIALARDSRGQPVAFQRFASADSGRELSLDVPYRTPEAPNGTDERLAVDVVSWARERGARRVSLAFAAFPELFAASGLGLHSLLRPLLHVLDPLIRVESLYRYLRKFHAFGPQRYVALRPAQLLGCVAAILWLEFRSERSKAARPQGSTGSPWRRRSVIHR